LSMLQKAPEYVSLVKKWTGRLVSQCDGRRLATKEEYFLFF